ncbi:MAG TPA: PLP-dependent aminotransferase family protein [Aromatoleum sp.]|uniref:MocR-like pyridoxine biosynthesis transcription factor PdxR n=1 Tax=Aromatoleum sp. TaxID=2307007 RepID=UPI002B49154D|nr:PLP-dependent aminotransferase family protein [Aromatoleum sp.]HJV24375.1 PLP-dependent aminotransferase family protein [Aromatoleum sp.]
MSRTPELDVPVQIVLNRDAGAPTLADQIAAQLRASICGGALRTGDRLPAIRLLAARLAVARATVDAAYGQLIAEGYLDAKPGAGTRVAGRLPEDALLLRSRGEGSQRPPEPRAARGLTERAQQVAAVASVLLPQQPVPLAVVCPSDELAPGKAWTRIAARLARTPWRHGGYAPPHGFMPLREAVADYARRFRGVVCEPEQVVITAGTQQGIALCAQLLFERGDPVWIEDPCYSLLAASVAFNGVRAIPVPVDGEGLDVAAGVAIAPDARGAFVSPSHQYPLGMAMPMARRLALLDWAREADRWIIEDDYDSELRYEGRPFPSLQGLDAGGEAVIYLGTFSKMLFPGLRLGYAIVPRALVEAFAGARLLADRHSSESQQAVLAEYMREGHYETHIRRIRTVFQKRREVLLEECEAQLSAFGAVIPGDQGMHLVFRFAADLPDVEITRRVRSAGVEVRPLSPFYRQAAPLKGFMLGFGGFAPESIRAAVGAIRRELDAAVKPSAKSRSG